MAKNLNNRDDTLNDDLPYSELFETDDDLEFFTEPVNENRDKNIKLSKKMQIALIAGAAVILVLLIIYFWGIFYFGSHFLPNTSVNGIEVGGETVEGALEKMNAALYNRKVTVRGKEGQTNSITGSEINLVFENNTDELNDLIQEQNVYLWFILALTPEDKELNTDFHYDMQKFDSIVDNFSLVSGPGVIAPENASIHYNGNEFEIKPAVEGNQPDVDELKKDIIQDLVDGENQINLEDEGLYVKPTITEDDQTLQDELVKFNTAIKAVITLTFPTQQVVIDKSVFSSWLKADNNEVILDNTLLSGYVATLASQFDNNGQLVSFTTSTGVTHTFQYNTGWQLNQQGEIDQLREQILNGEVVTEDPDWTRRGSNYITGRTISNNYIEISLENQSMWYYRNATLVSQSTIVSGNVATQQQSGTGLFFLQSKNTDVNMVVRQPDGNTANMQVRYWLPYSEQYGIESATWRNEFGGNIYRNQGTDGDIDVPLNMAQTLYDGADIGLPVVVY